MYTILKLHRSIRAEQEIYTYLNEYAITGKNEPKEGGGHRSPLRPVSSLSKSFFGHRKSGHNLVSEMFFLRSSPIGGLSNLFSYLRTMIHNPIKGQV